jgi:magnesium chelatase family protein
MLADDGRGEPSVVVAARVAEARRVAAARYAGTPWRTNNDVPPTELRRRWPIPRAATVTLEQALDRGTITARGYGRILRVAWTLADLQGKAVPTKEQVNQALGFRSGPASERLAA